MLFDFKALVIFSCSTFLLKRDGILIPESLTLTGQIVQSSIIEKDSFVNDPSVTLGYDIGKFLNEYQV